MQKELSQLEQLIERKKKYLFGVTEQRIINAVTVEINIIENFITAVKEKILEHNEYLNLSEKKIEQLEDNTFKYQGVLLLHGVHPFEWERFVAGKKEFIIHEVKQAQAGSYIQIAEAIRPLLKNDIEYYGEK